MPSLLAQRLGAGEAPALPGGATPMKVTYLSFGSSCCDGAQRAPHYARAAYSDEQSEEECAEGDGQIKSVRRAYRTMLNRVPRGA